MSEKRMTYNQLVAECQAQINELFPWDLEERMAAGDDMLLVDIREHHEYDTMHIENSICIPRGILEAATEWDYEETEPELVQARDRTVVLVCRSGHRTILAARNLKRLGFNDLWSLKTGLRGWNEYELPLVGVDEGPVDIDTADAYFVNKLLDYQRKPKDA